MREYQDSLRYITLNGERHDDRTGVGTFRIFGYMARYDLRGWKLPILTTRQMFPATIATELAWFMRGRTDVKWLNDRGCKIWDVEGWQDENGTIGPNYGFQWRHFGGAHPWDGDPTRAHMHGPTFAGGIDQLAELCDQLKQRSQSRRLLISAWNPVDLPEIPLPPCIVMMQFSLSESDYLSLMVTQRSCDIFVGGPHDVAQYAMLVMLLCVACDLRPGCLIHSVGDLHLYNNHRDAARELLRRKPFDRPTFVMTEAGLGAVEGKGVEGLEAFEPKEHFELVDYRHHEPISVEVAV